MPPEKRIPDNATIRTWKWFTFSAACGFDTYRTEESAREAAENMREHAIQLKDPSPVFWGKIEDWL